MLEATVVPDKKDILRLLATTWRLNADSISDIGRGTANCRIVGVDRERYFLKEYQQGMPHDQVLREMGVVHHLRRDGVPVGQIIPTQSGAGATVYRNRVFQLQSFLHGREFEKFGAPDWLSQELPRTLAAIVRSLESHPRLPASYKSWFERSLRDRVRLFEEFAFRAERTSWLTAEERGRVAESARRRVDAIRAVAMRGAPDVSFTVANTHGDYSVLQVICLESSIQAVVDFARASCLPVVWEVIRSFSYLDTGCREGGFEPSAFRRYVAEFEELVPLSKHDKAHMVDLYAYQLAPGTLGFREVLEAKSPGQKELIDFACWRTDLCETLISRRDELVEVLLQ